MSPKKRTETELYGPIRDLLEQQGYGVRAEVKNCDIVASKGEELVVVELKLRFSMDLLAQACDRQRITDSVYVAIPKTSFDSGAKKWRRNRLLLRRLELGLLVVDLDSRTPTVKIALQPLAYRRQKSKKRKRSVIHEMANRTAGQNEGGSVRRKLVTAYRENAIFIACALDEFGPLSAAKLQKLGAAPKARSIMYSNFYGWFDRISHGLYAVTPHGIEDLAGYKELASKFREHLREDGSVTSARKSRGA